MSQSLLCVQSEGVFRGPGQPRQWWGYSKGGAKVYEVSSPVVI